MAYRAVPGGVVRCPWCQSTLPPAAVECPSCRFPLALPDDVEPARPGEDGLPTTPSPNPALVPIARLAPPHSQRRRRRLAHLPWLLALIALLLLASAIMTLVTARRPALSRDAEAQSNLSTALRNAQSNTGGPPATVPGTHPSTGPGVVSVMVVDGRWYGAVRSRSGRCWIRTGLLTGTQGPFNTADPKAPCTGDEAQRLLAHQLDPR